MFPIDISIETRYYLDTKYILKKEYSHYKTTRNTLTKEEPVQRLLIMTESGGCSISFDRINNLIFLSVDFTKRLNIKNQEGVQIASCKAKRRGL
jgi:hypothetical protein